jgi:hypothetical protein
VKDESEAITHEKVVMRKPVNPNTAVHAGSRSLVMFITRMTMKQSQKERPSEPPREPMLRVATAILALNLYMETMY